MQHFYTCFSGLFSNLRTSIAQVQRTRFSETYSSLRNVFARLRQSVLAAGSDERQQSLGG